MRHRATTRRGALSSRWAAALAATVLIVAAAGPVGAQSVLEQFIPEAPSIRVSEVEVEDGTVTFELEVPPGIAGSRLDPSAVSVIIDGNYHFSEVTRPPADDLAIMLAVDISGSTADGPLEAAVAAADSFLDRLPEGSLVGLVSFGATAEIVSVPSADYTEVREGLAALSASGATTLFDGVALGAQTLSNSSATRRVIVVFSDGGDTQSSVTVEGARALAEAAGIRVDVVSLETQNSDPAALKALAGSDGSVIAVDDPDTLQDVFAELGDGLGNQFIVTIPNVEAGEIMIVVRGDDGVARGQFLINTGGTSEPVVVSESAPRISPNRVAQPTLPVVDTAPTIAAVPEAPFGPQLFTYAVAAILAGLLLAGLVIAWPTPDIARKPKKHKPVLQKKRSAMDAAKRLTALADAGLAKSDKRSNTAQKLEQAGSALRPGEFIVIVAAATLASLTIGTVALGPKMGIAIAVLTVIGSRVWLRRKIKTVRAAFADQLGGTLQLLASNLRVGHGLLQGVDALARESEQPTAQEFQRVVGEVRLGRDVGEALRAMADRLDNEDFRWVVQAIEIHREVGGDLGEVLDNVGITIRDRMRLEGQIHALSADGRISAAVMMALPFCVAGLMLASTPDYLNELTGRTGGQILLGIGALLLVIGGVWLKSIIRLQF